MPNNLIELTLVYPERSERVIGRVESLSDEGLLCSQDGGMRFCRYEIITDFRIVGNSKEQTNSPSSSNVHDLAEPGKTPAQEVESDYVRKKDNVQVSEAFLSSIQNFTYPEISSKALNTSALGRKIISANDKIAYAMKMGEPARLSEIPIRSLADETLRQYDPKVNLALARIAHFLNKHQIEFDVLNTHVMQREIDALLPTLKLLFESGLMQECAARARQAIKTFPRIQLPFTLQDLLILEGNEVGETSGHVDSVLAYAPEAALKSKSELKTGSPLEGERLDEKNPKQERSNEEPLSTSQSLQLKTGRIFQAYLDREAAIVRDDKSREYYLPFSAITSARLRKSLEQNFVGQEIAFIPTDNSASLSRPLIKNAFPVNDESIPIAKSDPTSNPELPQRSRYQQPRASTSQSLYRQAKQAHLSGQSAAAEQLFRQSIIKEQETVKSAIKDLGQLLDQLGRTKEAIDLLESNKRLFSSTDEISLLNLLANWKVKIEDFANAGRLYNRIYEHSSVKGKTRLVAAKQAAFCEFQLGNLEKALGILRSAEKYVETGDSDYYSFRDSLAEAVRTGTKAVPKSLIKLFTQQVTVRQAGPIMRGAVTACTFDLLDERSRDRGYFGPDDIRALQNAARQNRGERPALRAAFELNLAAVFESDFSLFDEDGHNDATFNYLTFSAEAAYVANNPDTVISYLVEAAQAISTKVKSRAAKVFRMAVALCMEPRLDAPDFFRAAGGGLELNLKTELERVLSRKRQTATVYLQHILCAAPCIREHIDTIDLNSKVRRDLEASLVDFQSALEGKINSLAEAQQFTGQANVRDVQLVQSRLTRISDLPLASDTSRLRQVSSFLTDIQHFLEHEDFVERELSLNTVRTKIERFAAECGQAPTNISAAYLLPIARQLLSSLEKEFGEYSQSVNTTLEIVDLFSNGNYTVNDHGITDLKLQIRATRGSAPVNDLTLELQESPDYEVIDFSLPKSLRAEEVKEGLVQIKVPSNIIDEGVISVFGRVYFVERSTGNRRFTEFSFAANLNASEEYLPIDNVYEKYGTGSPVDEPEMFFGRKDLVDRIVRSMTKRSGGQCYVLYGQKRTGKTSVLFRLREELQTDFLPVYFSLGEVDDPERLEASIYTLIFHEILRSAAKFSVFIPTSVVAAQHELPFSLRLRSVVDELNRLFIEKEGRPRTVVLLVDEFTYIYDAIKVGQTSPIFMRNWKNIIESKLLNAVIVGQDSMPRFISEFANEFGVSEKERLSYLTENASRELCESPILHDGRSRYRGKSLERIFEVTSGAAFFLQKFCFELVEYLNDRKRVLISQADVDHIFRSLVEGESRLQEADFDPMLQEASSATSMFTKDQNMSILRRIAAGTSDGRGAHIEGASLTEELRSILEDLQHRDVIHVDSNSRYMIRMELFAEWIRVNRPL